MIRRTLLAVLSASLLALAVSLPAQAQDYVEGEHYDVISPAIRGSSDKIEVTEFFWYGCGHCYNFEPMLEQWKKTLADDVAFTGSPAVWNKPMELHARAFYTAQALGVMDTMHNVIFQAMNVVRRTSFGAWK